MGNWFLNRIIKKVQTEDLSDLELKKIVEYAKTVMSPELAYELACITEGKIREEMEEIVLQQKNPMVCAKYAIDIPNAKFEEHKKIIFDSKNVESICYILNNIFPTADDVNKAQEIIIEKKDAKGAFEFCESVQGANVELMAQVAIDANDYEYIQKFSQIDGLNQKEFNLALGRHGIALKQGMPTDDLVK